MKAPRISFTIQVFASLLAGILCGLFFGEYTQILAPFGTIFIGLMQVTIIPSVVIFIITGIGSIGHEDAKKFLLTVASDPAVDLVSGYNRISFHAIRVSQCAQRLFF